jgi:Crp-like helix-turn-helix domain
MMVKRRPSSANQTPPAGNRNRLLAALPAADSTRILPSLTVVPLKLKDILHKPGEPIRDVFFPGGGFCSMLTVLEDGSMVEVATIGREGVEQRLARWLLMARDRMGRDDFPLTQEFVSMMLGASRPTVSIVAGTLQEAGLITYHRGHVKIVDGEKLEAASCECYRAATNLLRAVTDGSRLR